MYDLDTPCTLIVIVYVDNILTFSLCKGTFNEFKTWLAGEFSIKNLKPLHHYLVKQITFDWLKQSIRLSQDAYVKTVLRPVKMQDYKPAKSLIAKKNRAKVSLDADNEQFVCFY